MKLSIFFSFRFVCFAMQIIKWHVFLLQKSIVCGCHGIKMKPNPNCISITNEIFFRNTRRLFLFLDNCLFTLTEKYIHFFLFARFTWMYSRFLVSVENSFSFHFSFIFFFIYFVCITLSGDVVTIYFCYRHFNPSELQSTFLFSHLPFVFIIFSNSSKWQAEEEFAR